LADALIAAIHLDIFNRHCDRVHMANIAQTVNVLQSMILTQGDQMLLTPTYHIFNMYKHHQDNKLLPLNIISNDVIHEKFKLPAINGSASINKENNICLSLTNLNLEENYEIECNFLGSRINKNEINATILTSESLNAHNSFESPDNIRPENYPIDKFKISDNRISFEIPSRSVLFIILTQLE
ncbi:MAG: alpha-L-arabinofuranosidase C-terminal domain-containing protein, partial [Promethearchaeota archaeon]